MVPPRSSHSCICGAPGGPTDVLLHETDAQDAQKHDSYHQRTPQCGAHPPPINDTWNLLHILSNKLLKMVYCFHTLNYSLRIFHYSWHTLLKKKKAPEISLAQRRCLCKGSLCRNELPFRHLLHVVQCSNETWAGFGILCDFSLRERISVPTSSTVLHKCALKI